MGKEELKDKVIIYLNELINEWFDGNSIQDNLSKTIARTVLKANRNKYDTYLDLVTDEKGNVLVKDLFDNFTFEPIEIDLKKYSSMLPNKVLLFTQDDYNELKKRIVG